MSRRSQCGGLTRDVCPEILAPRGGGETMRKIRITVATVMVAGGLMAALAAPASADKGGNPPFASCGIGRDIAHEAIADTTSPGATEASHVKPAEVDCTGKG